MVNIKKRWLILLVIPAFLLVCAYLFVQSHFVSKQVASILSDTIGSEIEFGTGLRIKGLYPKLKVMIPNARLKADSDGPDGLQRARMENMLVSVSPSLLFNEASSGEIDVQLERASLITRSTDWLTNNTTQTSREVDVAQFRDAIAILEDTVERLAQLSISVSIEKLDYIERDSVQGSVQHHIKNALFLAEANALTASADIVWNNRNEQKITLTVTDLLLSDTGSLKSTEGQVAFDISPSVDEFSAARGSFEFAINHSGFSLEEFDFNNDWLWLRGVTTAIWDDTDIQLESDVELRSLELGTLGQKAINANQPTAQTNKRRLFPFDLFTVALPLNISSEAVIHLGAIRLDAMPVANGSLQLSLSEGVVQIESSDLTLLGGESNFSMEINNTLAQLVGFQLKLETDDIELNRIRVGNDAQTVLSRGTADTIIALKGEGPSLGHIASSIDGYVLASMADAQVNQRFSTLIDRGLVGWALERVSSLGRYVGLDPSETTGLSAPLTFDCASLRVYINDGRAEVSNGAVFELPDNSLFSSGYVDLASEELGFAFRTRSKSLFDWSAISIIKYAELSGSLQEPKASLNATELAKQGVKSASSAAWGPLPSLVYSLAEAGLKNSSNTECTPHIK